MVYPAHRQSLNHVRAVEEGGTPVLLLVDIHDAGLDVVAVDDEAGACRALAHLVEAEHRRFAMIDGGYTFGNRDKFYGACRALAEAGLPQDALSIYRPEGQSPAFAYDLMARMMAGTAPTAVFASTDSLGLGVLSWCRETGDSVPRDLAVIGYDNTEASEYGALPLSTVNYAADEISRIGVVRILSRIAAGSGWTGHGRRLIAPDLVIRQTT